MSLIKNRKYDLKKKRDKALKFAIIFSLSLFILAFKYIPPDNEPIVKEIACSFGGIGENNFIVCSAPEAPPKTKCPGPIITISEDEIYDIEFCSTELDITAAVNYPPPPLYDSLEQDEDEKIIECFQEMPEPIGGMVGIYKRIVYPESAIDRGIKGRVILRAYVDTRGNVYQVDVIKSLGGGCDAAAVKAVMDTKFTPGKQRGKPVKVMVAIPISFNLR